VSLRTKRRNHAKGPGPARTGAPASSERWLYGRHPVVAALANPERRWRRVAALAAQEEEAKALIAAARATRRGDGEPIRILDRPGFAALLGEEAVHQGLALEAEPLEALDLDDILRGAAMAERALAAAFGAKGVIVSAHGAPPVTGALAKAASGALELVPLIPVVNLVRALERLKEERFWCCGLDERAPELLGRLDLGARVALVLGAEGDGLRRLVREQCDYLARLPTTPAMPSLNVSTAAAIALYQLVTAGD